MMDTEDLVFMCSLDAPKSFSLALISIAWKEPESQSCYVRIDDNGLLFVTEDASCLQASVFLKASLFKSYTFIETEAYEFKLNLTSLVHCLSVFGDTALTLDVKIERGSDLQLKIHDQGSITECLIRTLHCSSEHSLQRSLSDAFSAPDACEVASFIISSYVCRELFRFPNERKNKANDISMTINVENRTFEVKAEGAYGIVRSSISLTQADFQRVHIGTPRNFTSSFSVWSMSPVLSAMTSSYETKFTFKDNGMLAIQQGIKGVSSPSGVDIIVEFILQPLDENNGL